MDKFLKTTKIKKRFIRILELLICVLEYAIILMIMSMIFPKTVQIDNSLFGIWGLAVSFIIFILNKTIKPIIFSITLPITALTLGIFYPFINYFILKMTDWIFFNIFNIKGIWMGLFVAIIISITNAIMDSLVVKPLLRKE